MKHKWITELFCKLFCISGVTPFYVRSSEGGSCKLLPPGVAVSSSANMIAVQAISTTPFSYERVFRYMAFSLFQLLEYLRSGRDVGPSLNA